MAVRIITSPVLPTAADRLPGNQVLFECDTTGELPSVNVIDNDMAFTVDTGTDYKRVAGAWVAQVGTATVAASYRVILDSSGSHIAARVAGTYWLGQSAAAGITGVGTLYPGNLIYLASADYPTINGLPTKLRVRATLLVNDVAPTGNYTFGLHPVTRPATSGGAGLCIYTIGAAVSGSTVVVNTPAADSSNFLVGSDFAFPSSGFYVLGFVSTTNVATSSHLHVCAKLQLRNA